MEQQPVLDQALAHEKRRARKRRLLVSVLVVAVVLMCGLAASTLVLMDQTALEGMLYLQAVQGGNTSVAEALGDHYSENRAANSQLYEMDLQRDIGWLGGAQVASVTTSREQTLSGQWATVLRFDWRPDSSAQWRHATLRVKTERWLLITYIRAVELVEN